MPNDSKVVTQKTLRHVVIGIAVAMILLCAGALAGLSITERLISQNQEEIRQNQIDGCYRANARSLQYNKLGGDLRSVATLFDEFLGKIETDPENIAEFETAREISRSIARNRVTVRTVNCEEAYKDK